MILASDSTIAQPTSSDAVASLFQSPKRAGAAAAAHRSVSYTSAYSSDEEDDSRDRQSHWKRIKTRCDDNPPSSNGRNVIRWTERDCRSNATTSYQAASPIRRPLQTLRAVPSPKKSVIPPRPGHRMIVLKSRLHGADVSRHPGIGHGGTEPTDAMDAAAAAAGKRKFEPEARRGMISMNIDMYERGMVVREQHMARRLPVERASPEGMYQVRVSGREEGEFYDGDDGDDDDAGASLLCEDSLPVEDRPRMTVDLREALNRRTRGVADTASRENRGYGDHPTSHRAAEPGFDVKVRVRRVDFDLSFKPSSAATAAPPPLERSHVRKKILPPSDHEGKSFAGLRIGTPSAAAVGSKGERERERERETEAERRRERWAEKERDLERDLQKELQKQQQQTMAKAPQHQPKSVTVVDYSHKFAVAKAPLGVPVKPVESDPHRLCQRQKQIDYGKNTLGYERYVEMVPRYQRTKAHPRTPDIRQVCSKRSWDGQIRKWRRLLHEYDPPKEDDDEDPDQMFVPTRDHDGLRGSSAHNCMIDAQSELVEDADLKIYDGWSDEEC